MKTVLCLGASIMQIEAIKKAKEMDIIRSLWTMTEMLLEEIWLMNFMKSVRLM